MAAGSYAAGASAAGGMPRRFIVFVVPPAPAEETWSFSATGRDRVAESTPRIRVLVSPGTER